MSASTPTGGECWRGECRSGCGYPGVCDLRSAAKPDPSTPTGGERERLLAGIRTHNGAPVTAENLRWAATHEALARSWIFDVLTGLADALDAPALSPSGGERCERCGDTGIEPDYSPNPDLVPCEACDPAASQERAQ